MVNNTGQDLIVFSEQDGEVLFKVRQGEGIRVRSEKQIKNDKYYSPQVKIKGSFIKVMDKEKDVVKMLLKYPSPYSALNIMKSYLVYNENILLNVDGTKYKGTDLARDMGITRQSAMAHFKRLQDMNLIAEIEVKKGKVWAINPNYYLRGETVSEKVLNAFKIK